MRRNDLGREAGRTGLMTAPNVSGLMPPTRHVAPGAYPILPDREPAVHAGVLTSGTADQLAALAARAAHASNALIHLIAGDRLRLYGGWGPLIPWDQVVDNPIEDSLAGVVAATGEPLIIGNLATDERVPARSMVRRLGPVGAYLGHPVRDHDGALLGVCCVFDASARNWTADEVAALAEAAQVGTLLITEQLARHEIDRQHRFLDAALDNLHDGMTACDPDGTIVLVNARMRALWGDPPADRTDDALVAGLREATGSALARALRGERLRDEEVALQSRSRRTRYYLMDAQPIVGPDGSTMGAIQAVQDVTRHKRAERFRTCELAVTTALAEARSVEAAGPRVLAAVTSLLDWVHAELWLVDEAAGILRSAAAFSTPGWESDIAVPDVLAYGQGLAGRAWQAGKPLWIRDVGQPQSLISRDTAAGSRLHAALAIPVRHGTEALGVLTVFADTVEDPEDDVVALLSGIGAHIGQFVERRLVEDLQRQLALSKNEYLALIGHELRTPLTSISAYTQILREADAPMLATEGPRLLEVIERNTNQLRHIINELLELSALDTGHAAVQLSPMDLADVVRQSVESARTAVAGEPLTISDDLPGELIVPGDRKRLQQIVDNLLGNAVKYSPDGGTISVTLRADGRAAELAVSDTGMGVSVDEREKMFTGLYRTSRARDRAIPGSGLGLTLSRAVVDRHHGTIELSEHDGPGTTVLVRLPIEPR